MNNYNPYVNQPQQQPQPQQSGTPLMVTLLPDISMADTYNLAPNSSMFFLDQGMTTLKMRSRDQNGFARPDRTWEIKETTPPPQTVEGPYVTKEEFNQLNGKLDKLLSAWQEFSK
jgi:hypothetical protein